MPMPMPSGQAFQCDGPSELACCPPHPLPLLCTLLPCREQTPRPPPLTPRPTPCHEQGRLTEPKGDTIPDLPSQEASQGSPPGSQLNTQLQAQVRGAAPVAAYGQHL
jgi:hypothetical protein